MATTRALAGDGEVIVNTELVVTSALAGWVTTFLPTVGDGTGATVADDTYITVWANSTGGVFVKDQYGHLIRAINPGESATFAAVSFGLGNAANRWAVYDNAERIPLKAVTEELAVGGGAAIAFGATTPAGIATPGAVNRFLVVVLSDGTLGKIPVWK
jgi:hypothetical protein